MNKNKFVYIFILLSLLSLELSSQMKKDNLGYEYDSRFGTKVLMPTWNNCFNTITMPEPLFKELMDMYGYKYIYENDYYWKMSKDKKSDFFIEHSVGKIQFSWKNCNISTYDIENTFDKYYIKTGENGIKVYMYKSIEINVFNYNKTGFVLVENK